MKGSTSRPEPRDRQPSSSRRREYRAWVEDQVESFKESISRNELLALADDVVTDLRINTRGQYQLTEVLLTEAVDRHIIRLLELPSYRAWIGAHPPPASPHSPESAGVEREPLPLPSAASF